MHLNSTQLYELIQINVNRTIEEISLQNNTFTYLLNIL